MSAPHLVIRRADWFGREKDLLMADGRVLELADHDPARSFGDAEVVEAHGAVLLPSLVDAHVHLREPGFEYKEDIASGLKAAARGGFGRVMAMANTSPVNDNADVTEAMLDTARRAHPDGPFLHPVGALTRGLKGEELSPMADMAQAGCIAFSNDGLPMASAAFFRKAVEYAATFNRPVIDHCENPTMNPGCGVNEGEVSSRLGLRAQPWVAEAEQVARDCLLAEFLGLPIHLAHVSCRASVDCIRTAKARGAPVTAETCPHYLTLTESSVEGYNTLAKVNPPLRTDEDVAALKAALADGTIDILATDHAPHADHEKETEFEAAPCGISGLETAMSLTWPLVESGLIDRERFADLWRHRPAELFGLEPVRLEPGDAADCILFDPSAGWTPSPDSLVSKGKNTPFRDTPLKGRVTAHVLGGVRVF
ncbi:dihydroorotase [Desulfohalovibrio reitneri]|uniref:dihydroorotase n=1 Tax=Desulfohalovibrio reitneri TaxID=1307759 RepID=UPI0004A73EBA|nr:dihydroorotase [Desulfohalovibrio reitneri]